MQVKEEGKGRKARKKMEKLRKNEVKIVATKNKNVGKLEGKDYEKIQKIAPQKKR